MALTRTGTPYYASPEIWKGKPYDSKSDLWSLGVSLYEICTLYAPFECESLEMLNQLIIKGKFKQIQSFYSRDLSLTITTLL